MPNPADDHAVYIANLIGGILGQTVLSDKKPESPDALVAVFNSSGMPTDELLNPAETGIRRPGLKVQIRGTPGDYTVARSKAEIIYLALCKKANYTVNGHHYIQCIALGDIGESIWDEKNRPNWYLNFELML